MRERDRDVPFRNSVNGLVTTPYPPGLLESFSSRQSSEKSAITLIFIVLEMCVWNHA